MYFKQIFCREDFSFCHFLRGTFLQSLNELLQRFYGYEGYYFKVMRVISYLNDYLK